MSGRKNSLAKFRLINAQSMGASITSNAVRIQFLDNIGVQLVFTGSPTGTFSLQVSIDHSEDELGNVTTPGNWIDVDLDPVPAAAGAPDLIYIDLNQLSAPFMRVVYNRTSGTGTLDCYVCGKMI